MYAPLHVHSDASPDGAGTIASLVAEAVRIGCPALALTDHGTLANAVAFWSACTDAGIKPILGMEAYLAYQGARHHVTILSLNEGGFNNLVYLDTDAHTNHYDGGYPMVTLDSLYIYRKGLYVLSGCASSALYKGDEADAAQYVGSLMEAVGRDNLSMEMMFVGTQDTWSRPYYLAGKLRIPYVITNDTHYPCQHQFPAHQVITEARRGFTYDSKHLWLKSRDEIMEEGSVYTGDPTLNQGLDQSLRIAEMAETWNMKAPPTLPHTPEAEERLVEYIRSSLIREVTLKKGKELRLERVRYELRILKEKGFLDYIYILWDIVAWAKSSGIRVGPGRGSGGGSYVLFLLGVTEVDPLEYDLMFERFINPSRADYPDVDVDFESDRRQEVMNYAADKWGTVPIATYSSYSHKSAVHDIARVLHIPKDLEIPAAEAGIDSEVFEEFLGEHKDASITYQTMLGQIRHRGKHAAGVIIANRPIPIERAGDELVAAWAEGMNTKDLSKVGIVKFDLLGLTALSQLKRMEELTGVKFNGHYDDRLIFALFCKGDTSGIFQWSGSEGIRDLTVRIAPRNFYDLTTCNALYRPGALDAGTAENYPHYMKEPRKLHPRIDPLLEKTYGVVCYQEQVMAIVAEVMGGDLAQADIVRRLVSKAAVGDLKWEAEIEDLMARFLVQGLEQGFNGDLLSKLWHEIYTHSGYSYNLAHATTYTMISYQMAWYKRYYRPAFTTAVLQYDKANAQTYIIDAIQSGIRIEMPNIEYSSDEYELEEFHGEQVIYLPLSDVSFLGEKAIDYIIRDRKENGGFGSYEEFGKRIPKKLCNNRTKGMLERIGAFKDLTGEASSIIDKYEDLPLKGEYDTQLEILGYVIPTSDLIKKMDVLRNREVKRGYLRYAGFISGIQQKKSIHGPYSVFTLSPQGSFWMREPRTWMKVGVFVSGSKSKFGHSNDVKRYNLD